MSGAIQAQLEATLHCPVRPLTQLSAHHNMHYKALKGKGGTLFVKIMSDNSKYYQAEIRAQLHLADTSILIPRLVDYGSLDETRRWLAYEWHDLARFTPTRDRLYRAGRIFGDLHSTTLDIRDDRLRRHGTLQELVLGKLELVLRLDPLLATRIWRIYDRIFAEWLDTSLDDRVCLLHGDAGWRNMGLDHEDQIWLFDFEHAAIGHPLLDFAKLWDREIFEIPDREAFLSGYRDSPASDAVTRSAEIDAIRLWAAAGIFPYARPREDHNFERFAYTILSRLERGL